MSKPITPYQALRFGAETATWIHSASLDGDPFQRLLQDRTRMRQVGDEIVTLVKSKLLVNPFRIVEPVRDYPPGFAMTSWEEQLEVLRNIWPKLNPDGLPEQARYYLEQQELWEQTFEWSLIGQAVKLYDGLLVFALPGKTAAKLGLGNLWEDVMVRGKNGQGVWGKLFEDVLFPEFVKKFPPPVNYRQGQMGADRFIPLDATIPWFQQLERQMPGDFACRPFNFGRRLAGYSVEAARWETENLLLGIPTPTWLNGQGLVTNPHRFLRSGFLALDCGGDQYRFEASRGFQRAPFFSRDGVWLRFDALVVAHAHGHCGSGFVLR